MSLLTTPAAWVLSAACLLTPTGGTAQPTKAAAPAGHAGGVPQSGSAVQSKFEQRLVAVDAKMAAVVDLRADFEQRKKTALLKKPLISSGSLVSKGEKVLWRTTSPRKSDMLIADGRVTVYYPDDKLAEMYPVGPGLDGVTGGPLPRLLALKELFELTEMDAKEVPVGADAQSTNRFGVRLVPRTDDLKKHVGSVRVVIDESVPCAEHIVIVDPDGEETQLRFTAVRINLGVKDNELELKMAEGTKVHSAASGGK